MYRRTGGDDQRDAQRRIVGKQPMRRFAVVAERFAMIRERDDESRFEQPGGTQTLDQAPELRVGERHLVVVRVRRKLFGRAIRRMRVEQVDPCEPGAGCWLLVARGWGLVAGYWGLGAGGRMLVAGGWLLGTGRSRRVRAPIRVFRAPSPQPPAPRENPVARELRHAICGAFGEGERDRTDLTADA